MLRYISVSSGAIGFTAAAFNNFFALLAFSDLADGGLQLKVRHLLSSVSSQFR
jgi:hypothetical protein